MGIHTVLDYVHFDYEARSKQNLIGQAIIKNVSLWRRRVREGDVPRPVQSAEAKLVLSCNRRLPSVVQSYNYTCTLFEVVV